MNEELKEQLMFAIFTAEAEGKTGIDKAFHIKNELRRKYGGSWTAIDKNEYSSYIEPAYGRLAVFDYEGKRWSVYEHDCACKLQADYLNLVQQSRRDMVEAQERWHEAITKSDENHRLMMKDTVEVCKSTITMITESNEQNFKKLMREGEKLNEKVDSMMKENMERLKKFIQSNNRSYDLGYGDSEYDAKDGKTWQMMKDASTNFKATIMMIAESNEGNLKELKNQISKMNRRMELMIKETRGKINESIQSRPLD